MSLVENLSSDQMNRFLGHDHPLDREAVSHAHEQGINSTKKVRVILSLWDTCFQNQNPDNYQKDWGTHKDAVARMYRSVRLNEFNVLVKVVEAAHNVSFSKNDRKVVMEAHDFHVRKNAPMPRSVLHLVVWHPEYARGRGLWE